MVINMKHVPDDLYVKPYETVAIEDKDYKSLNFKHRRHKIDNEGVSVYSRDEQIIRIDVCSNQMIRVRILRGKLKESITEKYGLISQPRNKTEWEVRVNTEKIILKTKTMKFHYSFINNEISLTNYIDEKILQIINGGVRFSEETPDYNSGHKIFAQFEIIKKEHFFGVRWQNNAS